MTKKLYNLNAINAPLGLHFKTFYSKQCIKTFTAGINNKLVFLIILHKYTSLLPYKVNYGRKKFYDTSTSLLICRINYVSHSVKTASWLN